MYITIENEVPITEKIEFQRSEIEKMKSQLLNSTLSNEKKRILRHSLTGHELELNKLLRS